MAQILLAMCAPLTLALSLLSLIFDLLSVKNLAFKPTQW